MVDRKSDVLIGVMRWGNAHGAKGDTAGSLFDGNVNHTQKRLVREFRRRASVRERLRSNAWWNSVHSRYRKAGETGNTKHT